MVIRRFYSKRRKPGWRKDTQRNEYFSWGFDIRRSDGKRIREGGFAKASDAEAAAAQIRAWEKDARYGFVRDRHRPTLAQLIDKRLATIADRRERVRSERTFKHLLGCLPAGICVEDLTRVDLQTFVDKRLGDGLKPSSVDRELNIIVATLNAAQVHYPEMSQWIPPKVSRPKGRKSRRERVLTTEEITKLLTYLFRPADNEQPQEYQARIRVGQIMKFALMSGARHGEINNIRWEHIDWERRTVQILGEKSANRADVIARYIPLSDPLLELLRDRQATEGQWPFVFTRGGNTNPSYYKIIRAASEAVGIPYGQKVDGGYVTHDARHSFVTRLLHAGVDLATIQSMTGHSSQTMALLYAHGTQESRDKAGEILADLMDPERRKIK